MHNLLRANHPPTITHTTKYNQLVNPTNHNSTTKRSKSSHLPQPGTTMHENTSAISPPAQSQQQQIKQTAQQRQQLPVRFLRHAADDAAARGSPVAGRPPSALDLHGRGVGVALHDDLALPSLPQLRTHHPTSQRQAPEHVLAICGRLEASPEHVL